MEVEKEGNERRSRVGQVSSPNAKFVNKQKVTRLLREEVMDMMAIVGGLGRGQSVRGRFQGLKRVIRR